MFKKGDKVKCVLYGKGRVSHIGTCDKYPLAVEFNKVGTTTNYTMDGRIFDDANPTLKHRTQKFKVGDRVKTDVWGEGVVTGIEKTSDLPIAVKFDLRIGCCHFTSDGRFIKHYPISLKKIKNKLNN
jgi:hypothetical protein